MHNNNFNIVGKFIPNTNKRYIITEKGKIYSQYKYNNKGKKYFKIKEIKAYLNIANAKSTVVNLQFRKYSLINKMKTVHVSTLMEKCFKLNPPDKFHFYDLTFKDGNCFNSELSNLEYRIRTHSASNYNYYPQPFYNLKSIITHKICGNCGDKKEIENFYLQNPSDRGKNKTYRNICEPCRSKIQWEKIKSDVNKLKKRNENSKKWAKTERGKAFYKSYSEKLTKYNYENITPHYLSSCLRLKQSDLTHELILLARKKILLIRTIKKQKNEKRN